MRTLEIKVYTYDELSYTAKETALNNNRDLNVNYDWWDWTIDDAGNFGIKINSFNLYPREISIELTLDPIDVANNILNECGPATDLYSIAETYIQDYNKLNLESYTDTLEDKLEDLYRSFKKQLSREYLDMLDKEYDYLQSDEAIIEAICANDIEFTEDGKNLRY